MINDLNTDNIGITNIKDQSQLIVIPITNYQYIKLHVDKVNKFIKRHKDMQNSIRELILNNNIDDMAPITLKTLQALSNNEASLDTNEYKVKILIGRQFNKYKY